MPLALVHVDPDSLEVLGVWLDPEQSAYLNRKGSPGFRRLGEEIMQSRGSAPTWEEWALHLSQKTPTVALWQTLDRNDGEEPRHVLARAVALEAVARRDK